MRRAMTSLVVILALQLALALLLLTRRDPLAGAATTALLLPADIVHSADHLVIESRPAASSSAAPGGSGAAPPQAAGSAGAARIELAKKNGQWVLPSAYDAPADGHRVGTLLDRLASLKRGLPIATTESALRRFKVVDEDFERRVVLGAGGKTLETVYFGASPGLRKSDARTAGDRAVYAVDLPTYELPTDTGSWLKADLLRTDTDKLTEMEVSTEPASPGAAAGKAIQLLRKKGADNQPDTWTDPALTGDQRLDSSHVDTLLLQAAELHVEGVLGTAAAPDWRQEHPALRLTLKNEQDHSAEWVLSKPASGDFYVLKSSSQPWYFQVSGTLGKQLIDAAGHEALIVSAKPAAAPPARQGAPGAKATGASGKAATPPAQGGSPVPKAAGRS